MSTPDIISKRFSDLNLKNGQIQDYYFFFGTLSKPIFSTKKNKSEITGKWVTG